MRPTAVARLRGPCRSPQTTDRDMRRGRDSLAECALMAGLKCRRTGHAAWWGTAPSAAVYGGSRLHDPVRVRLEDVP